jgi:hypothetical protein
MSVTAFVRAGSVPSIRRALSARDLDAPVTVIGCPVPTALAAGSRPGLHSLAYLFWLREARRQMVMAARHQPPALA